MRVIRFAARFAAVVASISIAAAPAHAGLADLIPNLFGQRIVLADPPPGFPSHAAHFLDDSDRLAAAGAALNESLVSQLATFPIGSSAGGFTYTYDSALGVFNRTTESFGPVYAERSQTLGQGKWNTGFSYQRAQYDSLDGIDLGTGDLAFPLIHQDVNNDGTTTNIFFEGDVLMARSRIEVDADTTVVFATYGVNDRLDLGVAVPLLSVDLMARADINVERLSTAGTGIHQFPGAADVLTSISEGSASGIGDVVLRGKYRLTGGTGGGLAAAIDVRLPTGDEEDLLGTGAVQSKLLLVASGGASRFALHGNLGYTFASGGDIDLPDEINYAGGFDVALHPRFTIAVDAIGRVLQDANTLEAGQRTLLFTTQGSSLVQSTTRPDLTNSTGDLSLLLGSVGLRFNPAGNLLITLNALFSLSDDGLQDEDVIPLVGIDYSF